MNTISFRERYIELNEVRLFFGRNEASNWYSYRYTITESPSAGETLGIGALLHR
jgi:hypothetical protein